MVETKKRRGLTIVLAVLAALLVLVCVCRIFFIDWYTVSGDSMYPTYQDGQVVFGLKVGNVDRFDAVVIDAEGLMDDPSIESLFKRVVAMEGDEVWSEDGILCVSVDGEVYRHISENYGEGVLDLMTKDIPRQTVPEGHVFVLGDNRITSIDSRIFGFVPLEKIEAVVL